MKQFFESLPSNHWSAFVILFIGILSTAYYFYFYFSKEGQDERGQTILAKAGFVGFVTSMIFMFGASFLYDFTVKNQTAYIWIILFIWMITSAIVGIVLAYFKKTQ